MRKRKTRKIIRKMKHIFKRWAEEMERNIIFQLFAASSILAVPGAMAFLVMFLERGGM